MAAYQNAAYHNVPASDTTIYTCPSGKSAILQGLRVCNLDTQPRKATVKVVQAAQPANQAASASTVTLANGVLIPAGVTYTEDDIALNAGDTISVAADVANKLDVFVSVITQ